MMTQPNPKFLRNTIIIVVIALIVAFIAVAFILMEYNIHRDDVGVNVHMDVITTIFSLLITIALVTVTAILVIVTFSYTKQTTRMANESATLAEETKKMVDHYYHIRKEDLMPLFIPLEYSTDNADNLTFRFINIGNVALFVHLKIIQTDDQTIEYCRERGQEITTGPLNLTETAICAIAYGDKGPERSELTFHISFQDKTSRQYKQIINFYFIKDRLEFSFDESCLPIEQKGINQDPV